MLKVKIKDIELTVDEAQEVYNELHKLFGTPTYSGPIWWNTDPIVGNGNSGGLIPCDTQVLLNNLQDYEY